MESTSLCFYKRNWYVYSTCTDNDCSKVHSERCLEIKKSKYPEAVGKKVDKNKTNILEDTMDYAENVLVDSISI